MDDVTLYAANMKELAILMITARNFLENTGMLSSFLLLTFYISANTFVGEMEAVFFVQRTDSSGKCFKALSTLMSHTRTESTYLL